MPLKSLCDADPLLGVVAILENVSIDGRDVDDICRRFGAKISNEIQIRKILGAGKLPFREMAFLCTLFSVTRDNLLISFCPDPILIFV